MIKLRTYFLLSAILLPLTGVVAQTRPINKEVEVKRPYDPSVVDAQKIWFDPTIDTDSLKAKDPVRYNVIPKSISSDFGLNPIASATFVERNRNNSGLGYVRLGAGYLPSTLGDFYISNNNASTVLLGLYANHRGFWDEVELDNGVIKKDVDADNMSNDIGTFIKVPFSSATLSVNFDYSGKRFHFYGYDPTWFISDPINNTYNKDSIRQTFNLYNANVQVESATSGDDRFDYGVGVSVQLFDDRSDMKENAVMGWATFGKHWDGMHNLSGTIRVANYNRNNRLDDLGANTLLYVQPSYIYTNGDFTGKLGLSFVGDQYDGDSKSKVYPALMASYRVADFFVPSIEVKGDTEVNSYRKLAYDCNYILPGLNNNIYIGESQKFRNTYRNFVIQGSLKGDIGSNISYNFYVSYSKIDDLSFFINEPQQSFLVPSSSPKPVTNNLGVMYEDGSVWNIGGEFRLDISPISIYAKAAYNKYKMDNMAEAVHRPKFETDITASYKFDNFVISANINMALKRHYIWINTLSAAPAEYYKLGNIYNLSGSLEYFITDKFSIFGNINNLLNKKYEVFHQYTVPGMMVIGGIIYRF